MAAAASNTVPLTITYTPASASAASTVTVLGQVLNNGGTNWIPATAASGSAAGGAIYLATTSIAGAQETTLEGQSYWLSTGPAVPAQVTISVTGTPSASGSASGAVTTGSGSAAKTTGSSAAAAATTTGTKASSSAAAGMTTSAGTASAASASGSASASTSSKSAGTKAGMWVGGAVVMVLCSFVLGTW